MNRLFELVFLIMEKEKLTAKEIADYFEISSRTVLRDIDKLIVAGIPIETTQGYDGGISLDPTYRLSLEFMNTAEKESLLAGLQAMDSVQGEAMAPLITRKIFKEHADQPALIDIDLSSWYGTTLIPKIELLKDVLTNKQKLSFTYYGPTSQSQKLISPHQLVFRWGNWYLRGFCHEKDAFRLYKLNRMDALIPLDEKAAEHTFIETTDFSDEQNYYLVANFSKQAAAKLIDSYGVGSFTEQDNQLHFERWFANHDYLISWLLSFGSAVEVIAPLEIRGEMKKISQQLNKIYEHDS